MEAEEALKLSQNWMQTEGRHLENERFTSFTNQWVVIGRMISHRYHFIGYNGMYQVKLIHVFHMDRNELHQRLYHCHCQCFPHEISNDRNSLMHLKGTQELNLQQD